ncbi:hypothetical protein GGR51DRAFT_542939 [Nemania sp. FL0031]|nr:hypothetical protein GGR51DRAFT_542939 [Nemania sp. FL0031]
MEELPTEPRGLKFQADFISREHEAQLLHIFQHELAWPERRKAAGSSRISLHWGYTFDYKTFGVDPEIPYKPFPEWLRPLIPRLPESELEKQGGRLPDQVCLQYYPPGAGIPPHVDTHSAFDQLYALSLGSAVTMQFRRPKPRGAGPGKNELGVDGNGNSNNNSNSHIVVKRGSELHGLNGNDESAAEVRGDREAETERETVDVDLPPRSMMEMSGDSRLHWEHGIRKRKKDVLADGTVRLRQDRWSITYRWLRAGGVCECGDERLCDTAQRRKGIEREYRWKQGLQDQEREEKQTGVDEKTQAVQVLENGMGNYGSESLGVVRENIETDNYHHDEENRILSPS